MTAIRRVVTSVGTGGLGLSVMDPAYRAVGDGTTNDTAAIQAAINDAASHYSTTGSSTIVLFPPGRVFLSSQLVILPGVTLWAYGATIQSTVTGWPSHGFLTWRPSGSPPPDGSILTDFGILGGLWRGSGLEDEAHNQYWLDVPTNTGMKDVAIRDVTVTGWGWVPLKVPNPSNVDISRNHFYGNEVKSNHGFQNTLNIFIQATAAFDGGFWTCRNRIHNATAQGIGLVIGLDAAGPSNGQLDWVCSENIITSDAPRVDTNGVSGATVTVTSGTAVVVDSACGAADVGKFVAGPGIPNVTYITSFTAGTPNTFTMSKNATAGGTAISVGVRRGSISLEIDATTVPITDFTIVNNDCTGSERAVIGISLPNTKTAQRGIIANNRITNQQAGTPTAPQGDGIKVGGQSAVSDIAIINNRVTAYNPIDVSGSGFTNAGLQSGNKFTTDAMQGRAVLVGGTVTVSTTEIRTGDNVILSRVVTGGTVGSLSVGTITDKASFTITSSSGADTSTVYWKIEH